MKKIKSLTQLKKEAKSFQAVEDYVNRALESIQTHISLALERGDIYVPINLQSHYVVPGMNLTTSRKYIFYYIFLELDKRGYKFSYYKGKRTGDYILSIQLTGETPKDVEEFLDNELKKFYKSK